MEETLLTQAQFDAIPVLAKQPASVGLIIRKFNGTHWIRIEYLSEGENGNWNIDFKKITVDDRARRKLIADGVISVLYTALQAEVEAGTLTATTGADLLNRIANVLNILKLGWIVESRVLCNNLSVAGALTTARKNYILARLDEAIALL